MKNTHILLLCILGAALVSTVVCQMAIGPKECCFDFYPNRIRKNLIRSYYMTDIQCSRAGIILVTARSNICMDPTDPWVQSIQKTLDKKFL